MGNKGDSKHHFFIFDHHPTNFRLFYVLIKYISACGNKRKMSLYRFSKVRFVDGKELLASGLPVAPSEFETMVKKQCAKTREFLRKT